MDHYRLPICFYASHRLHIATWLFFIFLMVNFNMPKYSRTTIPQKPGPPYVHTSIEGKSVKISCKVKHFGRVHIKLIRHQDKKILLRHTWQSRSWYLIESKIVVLLKDVGTRDSGTYEWLIDFENFTRKRAKFALNILDAEALRIWDRTLNSKVWNSRVINSVMNSIICLTTSRKYVWFFHGVHVDFEWKEKFPNFVMAQDRDIKQICVPELVIKKDAIFTIVSLEEKEELLIHVNVGIFTMYADITWYLDSPANITIFPARLEDHHMLWVSRRKRYGY